MSRLIVTLTTIPERIKTVPIVIEALFRQTLKPDMIVLYLGDDKFENKEHDLPKELLEQTGRGLSIHWVKDIGCFTGLIPALIEFPDDIIINIDDDINYNKKFIAELYNSYKKNPDAIHTHAARRIQFDFDDILLPYVEWPSVNQYFDNCICFNILRFFVRIKHYLKFAANPSHSAAYSINIKTPSFQNFIISTFGTLYPPHCLHDDAKNVDLAFSLCPRNDDVWFWTHAIRKNTKIQIAKFGRNKYSFIKGTQEYGLFNTNTKKSDSDNNRNLTPNDNQLNNVINYFPDLMNNIKSEPLSYRLKEYKIYLFGFIPLLNIFHFNRRNTIIALFDIIPLLIKKDEKRL